MIFVAKGLTGTPGAVPHVLSESGTLNECFNLHRNLMNERYSSMARNGKYYESISVFCVFENSSGEPEEYIAGIWTKEGRYEPRFPDPQVRYPEWDR
jgi:hypothetical protein